jgi:hypothetical protein
MRTSALSRRFLRPLTVKIAQRGVGAGSQVSRARFLGSSRPLTPGSLLPQLDWDESQVLSEIHPITGKTSCAAKRPKPALCIQSLSMATLLVPPTMYSDRQSSMISCSNALPWREGWGVQSDCRPETTATGQNGLPRMRTALHDLCVALPGAQHPIQTNRQFVGDSHFGHAVMLVHRQT